MQKADFRVFAFNGGLSVKLYGDWCTISFADAARALAAEIASREAKRIVVDIGGASSFDSAAALFFVLLKKEDSRIGLIGFSPSTKALFRIVLRHSRVVPSLQKPGRQNALERFGRHLYSQIGDFFGYAEMIGRLIISGLKIFNRQNFKFLSIVRQIELSSVNALPIVALSAFLIGVVVTYQGALQLEKFGAAIFTVDLVGISISRELAPLLTAVVIAGRSGASYTSEIGVMKITEEIDAMKTMGFSPYYFLVWPRILALTLSLWLVILFADLVAIVGGMMIAKLQLGITYMEFLTRLQSSLALKHVIVGLVKAPFFAFLISSIAVFRGLQVEGSSESIGAMTTHSVVNSIFAVIACDAVFAVIFTTLGI